MNYLHTSPSILGPDPPDPASRRRLARKFGVIYVCLLSYLILCPGVGVTSL